jgi:hypothetical protein
MTGSAASSASTANNASPARMNSVKRGTNIGGRDGGGPFCTAQKYVGLSRAASPAKVAAAMAIDWAEIQKDVDAQLERAGVAENTDAGLDRVQVETHARAVASGAVSKATNAVAGVPRIAGHEHVESLERLPARERSELEALGRDAISRGRVAVAVLNGGMATRFGGDVKGIIPAVGGRTFLEARPGARLRPACRS